MAPKKNEIEKALKKLYEGIRRYNKEYERLREANSSSSNKEKIAEDSKSQIKRDQRERAQAVQWTAEKTVKDTNPLKEASNQIEVLMHDFQDFERDVRTRRFSEAGLKRVEKLCPEERKRQDLERSNPKAQWHPPASDVEDGLVTSALRPRRLRRTAQRDTSPGLLQGRHLSALKSLLAQVSQVSQGPPGPPGAPPAQDSAGGTLHANLRVG